MIKERQNLMDGLLDEMNRVREIIKEYEHPSLKGAGAFAVHEMQANIKRAENAISFGDTIEMLRQYEQLKTWEL